MDTLDLKRLNSHLGLSSDSIRQVCTNKNIEDMLQRWPAVIDAHYAITASRRQQQTLSQQLTLSGAESPDTFKSRDVSAN